MQLSILCYRCTAYGQQLWRSCAPQRQTALVCTIESVGRILVVTVSAPLLFDYCQQPSGLRARVLGGNVFRIHCIAVHSCTRMRKYCSAAIPREVLLRFGQGPTAAMDVYGFAAANCIACACTRRRCHLNQCLLSYVTLSLHKLLWRMATPAGGRRTALRSRTAAEDIRDLAAANCIPCACTQACCNSSQYPCGYASGDTTVQAATTVFSLPYLVIVHSSVGTAQEKQGHQKVTRHH